jgi:hypothetical protein
MAEIGTKTVEDAARELAGNWAKWDSFVWHRRRELDDPDSWSVIYTQHRDSGLLAVSNASVIAEKLAPFADGDDPDVVAGRHDHWACGWTDGYSIRVYRDGRITDAFRAYHELAEQMADYPVLDESDYSQREYDATLANITDAAYRLKHEYALPVGWECSVFSWCWDNNPSAVDNRDDQGGYPSEQALRQAFEALGYKPAND